MNNLHCKICNGTHFTKDCPNDDGVHVSSSTTNSNIVPNTLSHKTINTKAPSRESWGKTPQSTTQQETLDTSTVPTTSKTRKSIAIGIKDPEIREGTPSAIPPRATNDTDAKKKKTLLAPSPEEQPLSPNKLWSKFNPNLEEKEPQRIVKLTTTETTESTLRIVESRESKATRDVVDVTAPVTIPPSREKNILQIKNPARQVIDVSNDPDAKKKKALLIKDPTTREEIQIIPTSPMTLNNDEPTPVAKELLEQATTPDSASPVDYWGLFAEKPMEPSQNESNVETKTQNGNYDPIPYIDASSEFVALLKGGTPIKPSSTSPSPPSVNPNVTSTATTNSLTTTTITGATQKSVPPLSTPPAKPKEAPKPSPKSQNFGKQTPSIITLSIESSSTVSTQPQQIISQTHFFNKSGPKALTIEEPPPSVKSKALPIED